MADDFKKLPMTRRGFLGTLAGGIAALLGGGSKIFIGAKVAEEIIKPAMQAEGMPSWFPLLVNKVRDKGKITRQSDYLEAKQEGINIIEYELKDKSLSGGSIRMTEDLNTGEITIWGRGDEAQQVDLTYTPGDRVINVESGKVTEAPHSFDAGSTLKDPDIGWKANLEKHPVNVKKDGTFEADEFWKGETHDVEVSGTMDDLRGDLSSWEKIATVGSKQSVKEAEEAITNFINRNKKPVEPDFAQGGRVGYDNGGIIDQYSENPELIPLETSLGPETQELLKGNLDLSIESGTDLKKEATLHFLKEIEEINGLTFDGVISKKEGEDKKWMAQLLFEKAITDNLKFNAFAQTNGNQDRGGARLTYSFNKGGIVSKRRDPFYNGMGSLFKERA